MGPELMAAIVGPLIAGTVSVIIWIGNRNAKSIDLGFTKLQTTVERIDERINKVDDKVEELRQDVAENFVSNARFEDHIDLEASFHARSAEQMKQLRDELKETAKMYSDHENKLRNDISDIKEMQWKTRLGILDLVDRKLGRYHNDGDVFGSDIFGENDKDES